MAVTQVDYERLGAATKMGLVDLSDLDHRSLRHQRPPVPARSLGAGTPAGSLISRRTVRYLDCATYSAELAYLGIWPL